MTEQPPAPIQEALISSVPISPDFPEVRLSMMKFRARGHGRLSLSLRPRDPIGTLVRCRFQNEYAAAAKEPQAAEPCPVCL
jgi:hypothetical protein